MATTDTTWQVLPHGPLERLADGLWRVEGALPGMPLRRVMAVVRRGDGRLILHSAIALDPDGMAALDRLGEVAVVVVPNGWHRLDAPRFRARYPAAQVVCPPDARRRVERVVPVGATYDEVGADEVVSFEVLDGTGGAEGAIIVRGPGGTSVVLNDAVFNMPHLGGTHGFVLRHITGSSGGPRVSRLMRWFVVKDRAAFRRHLERLAALPDLRRVLVAHHQPIDHEPARTLGEVAAALG